jgi:hypothetical protein
MLTMLYSDCKLVVGQVDILLGRIESYDVHFTGRDDSMSSVAYICLTFYTDTGDSISMDSTGTQLPFEYKSNDDKYYVDDTEKKFRTAVWNHELDDNATAYWEITELASDELEDDPAENHFYKISLYTKTRSLLDSWYIDYNKPLTIEYQRCGVNIVLIHG